MSPRCKLATFLGWERPADAQVHKLSVFPQPTPTPPPQGPGFPQERAPPTAQQPGHSRSRAQERTQEEERGRGQGRCRSEFRSREKEHDGLMAQKHTHCTQKPGCPGIRGVLAGTEHLEGSLSCISSGVALPPHP